MLTEIEHDVLNIFSQWINLRYYIDAERVDDNWIIEICKINEFQVMSSKWWETSLMN